MATPAEAEIVTSPRSREPASAPSAYEPPYRWAAFVGLGAFLLYVITLAPTTAFWDTSEYITTGHILGIPHPPGNPVFVFFARAWTLLLAPLPVSTAVKINMFSAANGAAAAAFWFLVAHRILAFFSEEELFRRIGALGAALISATAFTVWNQSVVNEKVYPVSLMTVALLTWLIFRWRDNQGRGKDDNLLILMVFVLALSVGNHLMVFLAAPALAIFVIAVHPGVLMRWQLYGFAAFAWALGLSAQLALPIRAENRPVIAEGDPRCESLVDASKDILTFGRSRSCEALASSLMREQYRKPALSVNPIFPGREEPRGFELTKWQFINYAQYFDWQWARSLDGKNTFLAGARAPFTLLFLLLGLIGAWRHFQRDRISWLYFAVLFATVSFGLVIYLNFKYGYSVGATTLSGGESVPVPRAWREVRERDYFFIVSFSQWGIWAGIGLAAVWQAVAGAAAKAAGRLTSTSYLRTIPVMALALLPMMLNWQYGSRAGDHAARDWAYNVLMSVEPYGVVFTNGDNDTFPLWYLQEVEGLRRDVTVIVYSYLATSWYAKQLRDLTKPCGEEDPLADPTVITCQRPFEPDRAVELYRDREWKVPTKSMLAMSDAEIDNLPDCHPRDSFGACRAFSDSVVVPIGQITGLIAPGRNLVRNDILVLSILQTTAGDRPAYFASTTGTYERFNLQPYLIRQGVAYKLATSEVTAGDSLLLYPPATRRQGGGIRPYWIDMDRTNALLNDYYIYRDLPEWSFWPDLSTNGIPLQYYQAYTALATGYLVRGDNEQAQEALMKGLAFAEVSLGQALSMPNLGGPVESGSLGPGDRGIVPIEIVDGSDSGPPSNSLSQ